MANEGEIVVRRGNPFQVEQHVETTALTTIESNRAIAEVQARLVVAQKCPRDQGAAWSRIMQACKRPGLAEKAIYSFPRGGQTVTGPSIRLAEAMAQNWGNLDSGIAEISRSEGVSDVEAWCWDLETNTRNSVRFQVRHIRDTKAGSRPLTDERDIYELVANMGARRKRACILATIPGDVIEDATNAVRETLKQGGGEPLKDRIKKLLASFSKMEVSSDMLVRYLGHPIDQTTSDEFADLRGVYQSIKDGQAKPSEFFGGNQDGAMRGLKELAQQRIAQSNNPLDEIRAEFSACKDIDTVSETMARLQGTHDESIKGDIAKMASDRIRELR